MSTARTVAALMSLSLVVVAAACAHESSRSDGSPKTEKATESPPSHPDLVDRAAAWLPEDTKLVVTSRHPTETIRLGHGIAQRFVSGFRPSPSGETTSADEIQRRLPKEIEAIFPADARAAFRKAIGKSARVDAFAAGVGGRWSTLVLVGRLDPQDLTVADRVDGVDVLELPAKDLCKWKMVKGHSSDADPQTTGGNGESPCGDHLYLVRPGASADALIVFRSLEAARQAIDAHEHDDQARLARSPRHSTYRKLFEQFSSPSTVVGVLKPGGTGAGGSEDSSQPRRIAVGLGEKLEAVFTGRSAFLDSIQNNVDRAESALTSESSGSTFTPDAMSAMFERLERQRSSDTLRYRLPAEATARYRWLALEVPRALAMEWFSIQVGKGMCHAYPHACDR